MRRVLVLFFAFVLAAGAQSSRTGGALRVLVLDPSGAAVPGAQLSLERADAGVSRTAETGANGVALLQNLPSGDYALHVEVDGFRPVRVGDVAVSLGRAIEQTVVLEPAAVSEVVNVTASAASVDAQSASAGVSLGSERIEEGPSNRNYLTFVLVAPGVAQSAGSNSQRSLVGLRNARGDSGFAFGGMRGRNNSLSIDGVDNRDEAMGGNRVAIGVEMVQEFRVSGAAITAENGGASGGSVNVVTRSGQNIWHGDFTYFMQNERFNARDSEVGVAQRPRYRKYQPGTSLLGPIEHNRTFFGMALEQVWESGEEWSDVPADAADSLNRALASPGFANSPVASVAPGLFPSSSAETEFSYKLDHRLTDSHQLTARYAYSRGRISDEVHGLDNFADRSARGSSRTLDQSFVVGLTSVGGPSFVNDLRFQASARDVRLRPEFRRPALFHPRGHRHRPRLHARFGSQRRPLGDRRQRQRHSRVEPNQLRRPLAPRPISISIRRPLRRHFSVSHPGSFQRGPAGRLHPNFR